MSIIYDALKKVEESHNITSTAKTNKEGKRQNKIYLLLINVFVVCSGIFIASIFWRFLTKPLPTNNMVPKNLPRIIKETPKVNLETKPPVSAETKEEIKNNLVLNGVFFSGDEGYALINNQIVKEGDLIAGAVVKRISLDEIELESEGSIIKLSPHK